MYFANSDKANILNDQFFSVFTREDTSFIPGDTYPAMTPVNVTVNGVESLLSNLDPGKAGGSDGLPTRFLKEMAMDVTPSLTLIFQASLHRGDVPDDWKKAQVVPIYKNGDHSSPVNYRPISLAGIVCKTLEHILSASTCTHLDKLCMEQHGFLKIKSCDTQLISTIHDFCN